MTDTICVLCKSAVPIFKYLDCDYSTCSNTLFQAVLENVLEHKLVVNDDLCVCKNCVELLNELDLADTTYKILKQKFVEYCIGWEVQSKKSDVCCQTDDLLTIAYGFSECDYGISNISEHPQKIDSSSQTNDLIRLAYNLSACDDSLNEVADKLEIKFINSNCFGDGYNNYIFASDYKCYICGLMLTSQETVINHLKASHHITIKKVEKASLSNSPIKKIVNKTEEKTKTTKAIIIGDQNINEYVDKNAFEEIPSSDEGCTDDYYTDVIITEQSNTDLTPTVTNNAKQNTKYQRNGIGSIIISNCNIIDELLEVNKSMKPAKRDNRQNSSIHTCEKCLKTWLSQDVLTKHICRKSEVLSFICEICGQVFNHKSVLNNHFRVHNRKRPCVCIYCFKPFINKASLVRHLRIHTGETRYQCDLCGKRFIHNSSFTTHMLLHAGRKDFKCLECGLAVFSRTHLERHMRVHTGEKPYSCGICSKRFAERYNLQSHVKVHKIDSET